MNHVEKATQNEPGPIWPGSSRSDRDTSLYGTLWVVVACLAVLATLLLPGCGDPSRAHAVNEPTARDALKTALDGWKNGETPASFASAGSPMIVQDFEWESGAKLLDYQLVDDGKAYDANLRVQVKLTLAGCRCQGGTLPARRRRKRSGTWSARAPRSRSSVICSENEISRFTFFTEFSNDGHQIRPGNGRLSFLPRA